MTTSTISKDIFNFAIPTTIKFGTGISKNIGEISKSLKMRKVLCIYDAGIKNSGISSEIIEFLEREEIKVVSYDQVIANPSDEIVSEAANFAKQEEVDGIIAIGGGSSIDCAKAVNILLSNPDSIDKYEGRDMVKNETKPLIAIPTTSGTGSEVTAVTVVTDSKKLRKMLISGQYCGVDIAVLDPELTIGLPPQVTAGTGMDALTHAIEAYLSKGSSAITDLHAIRAIELISHNIHEATVNGKNIEARSNMLLGSMLAGIAFNSAGLGLVHAISHPISSHCGVPHGVANALLLPHVLAYNGEEENIQNRMKDIALSMNLPVHDIEDHQAIVDLVVKKVLELNAKVNIPSLQETGVERADFEKIAEDALKERSMTFTPRKATKEDVIQILENSY